MRRVLEDFGTYLNSMGVGKVGTNMFIGNLPNEPDKLLGIFSSGGLIATDPTYRPAVQILIRDSAGNLGTVSNLADHVFELLDDKWNVLPRFKGRVTATVPPGANYRDEKGRWVYSLNFQVTTVITTISTAGSL